jgi:hypothetical protein
MEHTWYECPQPCDKEYCHYCYGGLDTCTVCGASEGELLESWVDDPPPFRDAVDGSAAQK